MYGVDISEDMKKTALKRNNRALKSGQLFLEIGNCCDLPYENDMFSAVSSINTIYFQSNTVKGLSEIQRVLKIDVDELIELGKEAGFEKVEVRDVVKGKSLMVICTKQNLSQFLLQETTINVTLSKKIELLH